MHIYFAPAKINRKLKISNEVTEGRHELVTHMQFLTWGDELVLEAKACTDRIVIEMELETFMDEAIPSEQDNLVWRAARALQQKHRVREGAHIWIKKRVPMAAGLGGGSSNAATALLGLREAWRLDHCSNEALAALAVNLGCDIPFFLYGQAAEATHWGETLSFQNFSEAPVVILKLLKEHVSTRQAYQVLDLQRDRGQEGGPALNNDFEMILSLLAPETSRILNRLRKEGVRVTLTGTGAALVVWGDPAVTLPRLQAITSNHPVMLQVTQTTNRTPFCKNLNRAWGPSTP